MQVVGITVGLPVSNLAGAVAWYQQAFELGPPAQAPVEGIVEFDLGVFWLQLVTSDDPASTMAQVTPNLRVRNAAWEHQRLHYMGCRVSPLERIEGVGEFFDLTDPDGNTISFSTELG